jgi:(2Fe-2S) ferredoxin
VKQKRNPYRHIIFVCTDDNCAEAKSKKLRDELRELIKDRALDEDIRCARTGCLGKCCDGPNVVVTPGDRWFTGVKPKDAEDLLDAVLRGNTED